MERSRAAALAPSADWAAPDLGTPRVASLSERLEALHSVAALPEEVTSFMEGLTLPLGIKETPRHRADLLLDVLEDERLCEISTHDGFLVGPAVLEALQALGFPYALEVTPEMLARVHQRTSTRARTLARTTWGIGLCLLSTVLVVPYFRPIDSFATFQNSLSLGALLMVPALATAVCRRQGWHILHRLFSCLHWVTAGYLLFLTTNMWEHKPTPLLLLAPGGAVLSLLSAMSLHRGPSKTP